MTLTELLKLGNQTYADRFTVMKLRGELCFVNDICKRDEHEQYLKAILKIASALLRLAVVVESAVDETNRFESWGERSYEWSRHRDEIEAALDLVGEAMK